MTRGVPTLAKRLLNHRLLPAAVAVLAIAMSLPSLRLGLQLDDHFLRVGLTKPPPVPAWSKGPTEVFAFIDGNPAHTRELVDAGFLPWWTSPDFRAAFFRPLASGFSRCSRTIAGAGAVLAGIWSSRAELLLALLGGELGIATAAYLLAYAVCLDTGTVRSRVTSLVPAAIRPRADSLQPEDARGHSGGVPVEVKSR